MEVGESDIGEVIITKSDFAGEDFVIFGISKEEKVRGRCIPGGGDDVPANDVKSLGVEKHWVNRGNVLQDFA